MPYMEEQVVGYQLGRISKHFKLMPRMQELIVLRWETITDYTLCLDPVKIKKGDNLTMEAHYDSTKHRL
jgi:uncharacterized protein (DUF927 family)